MFAALSEIEQGAHATSGSNNRGARSLFRNRDETATETLQERRRQARLERQQSRREEAMVRRRAILEATMEAEEQFNNRQPRNEERQAKMYRKWKNKRGWSLNFCYPEWMCDVPANLKEKWYVIARPAGTRCLLYAKGGWTSCRKQNGVLCDEFYSLLPGGSERSYRGRATTVLDCVYNDETETYYVFSILKWGPMELYDKNATFREFFMTKFQEVNCGEYSDHNERLIKPLPYFPCTAEHLQMCYNWSEYPIDGFYFLHRDGLYETGEASPLILRWKDQKTSPWFIDSDNGQQSNTVEVCRLRVCENGDCTTLDNVSLFQLDENTRSSHNMFPEQIAKFAIEHFDETTRNANLRFLKPCNVRTLPDCLSRIEFQCRARKGRHVVFNDILAVLMANAKTLAEIEDELISEFFQNLEFGPNTRQQEMQTEENITNVNMDTMDISNFNFGYRPEIPTMEDEDMVEDNTVNSNTTTNHIPLNFTSNVNVDAMLENRV